MRTVFAWALFLATTIVIVAEAKRPTPFFSNNYKIDGVLSLPYAELNEPFVAWFDKDSRRSRADFYGDLYQVYQFGPDKHSTELQYGAIYKFAWVPATSTTPANNADNSNHKTKTQRACFKVLGSDVGAFGPQTVLPDLDEFVFDSVGACPVSSIRYHHGQSCELWKLTSSVGEKNNVYKMWLRRDKQTNMPIPVHYYMRGYDSLLGSHYDRYDVRYFNYLPGGANATDFEFEGQNAKLNCGPMPGPGADAYSSEYRAHLVVQNPFHEVITEPHRYDHVDFEHYKFMQRYQKNYTTEKDHKHSWKTFLRNLRLIHSHNRKLRHYKLGVNQFADNEMNSLSYLRGWRHTDGYNGGRVYESPRRFVASSQARSLEALVADAVSPLPEYWDWRLQGAVTPVKDQAVCGSCWSFGTSGAIEGALFVQAGGEKLVRLSQQQMIDCSWPYGNNGCDGGEDFRAYNYISNSGGLASEEDYGAYLGVDGRCHDADVKKTVALDGFYNVTPNSVQDLRDALVTYGPVTVAIDASPATFTFYSHGVFYDDKCKNSPDGLDHQVLVVGYGQLDGQEYWLVKNSWSTYWGNDGYILMAARDNNCGVMTVPTVPIVKKVTQQQSSVVVRRDEAAFSTTEASSV